MKMILLFVVALSGCTTAREINLQDGSKGFNIVCNGSANSMASCYQKAGEMCGAKGYTIANADRESNQYGLSTGHVSANTTNAQGGYVSQHGALVSRSLMVRCND